MEPSYGTEGKPECFDDIRKLIETKHVDIKSELAKGHVLHDKVQEMTAQMDELNTTITSEIRPALSDSTEQLQRATAELAETSQLLQLAEQLLRLCRQLAESRQLQEAGQLTAAARLVSELRQQAQQLADQTGDQVALVSDLQERALVQEESVLHALVGRWRAALCWDDATGALTVQPALLPDTAAGLRRLGRLQRHLQRLADGVLTRLVEPLLAGGALEQRRDGDTLTVSVRAVPGETSNEQADSLKNGAAPPPEEDAVQAVEAVYDSLTALVTALRDCALPGPLMAEFGALAGPPLAERLVAGPLAAAIPSGLQHRARFDRAIQSTETFSAALAELGLWERAGALLTYVSDVDRLMVDRVCADRLEAARRLVAAELHDTAPIGDRPPAGESQPQDGELPHSLLRLPRCRVSRSAVQFADLVEATVSEAAAGPELLSARLHYTARHMLELYCALLPTQHRRQLETLPQQAAIAHNNLQLLAHRVSTLTVRHRCTDGAFLDMVPELRQTGSDLFLAALTRMKEQLLEILSEAGLEQLDTQTDVLGPAGAALRQCRHQLRHVCRVWRPVLPAAIMARAAGLLLSVVSGRLTDRLLAQQDISAIAATHLAQAAREFVKDAPQLFRPEEEDEEQTDPQHQQQPVSEAEARALLARHTAGWARFNELIIVLEENLRGILDRWSDGKGPLAQHFTADEARHLVRALFQNNERRAATLARIK